MPRFRGTNRRQVLDALKASGKPMRAYELLEFLKPYGIVSPPIIYRALAQLVDEGEVQRLESIHAYVARDNPADSTTVYAICRDCGCATALADRHIAEALRASAKANDFQADETIIELKGRCAPCAGRAFAA